MICEAGTLRTALGRAQAHYYDASAHRRARDMHRSDRKIDTEK